MAGRKSTPIPQNRKEPWKVIWKTKQKKQTWVKQRLIIKSPVKRNRQYYFFTSSPRAKNNNKKQSKTIINSKNQINNWGGGGRREMLWYETDAVVSLCAVTKLCFDCLRFGLLLWRWGWLERFLLPLVYLWDCILQHGDVFGHLWICVWQQ